MEEPAFKFEIPRSDIDNVVIDPSIEDPLKQVIVIATFRDFVVKEPGRFKVRAFRGDDEIRLGTLDVILNPAVAAAAEKKEAAN
jgi:hypothetical protein